ncbi:extracellular solute-binding protein [Leucobacter sp. USHLN153]|uniref:extracellular solute-binding protein n=1 Tax=Leucobacter sp. USHLN153 TaxID=3081268 RepID=UPI0030181C24
MKDMRKKSVLVLASISVAALLMSGCSSDDGSASSDDVERDFGPVEAGSVAEGSAKGLTLTYAGAGGVFQDGITKAIWDPFAEESGATFNQDAYDPGKLKAMVESGNVSWNLVNATQFETARSCGTLFEKYDMDNIDVSKVPEGLITDDCMVPNLLYGLTLVYNTDEFGDNPPTSAADFFDTKKFPGTRTVGAGGQADPQLIEFSLLAQGKDPDSITVDDIQGGLDHLKTLGDDLITWTTGAQAQQQLESGEAVMGLVWSGRGYGAAAAGAPVAPMWDEWMIMVDSLAMPKGVPDKRATEAATNFFLGAEQQAGMTEETAYGGVNVDAKPELDELTKSWLPTEHLDSGIKPNVDFWVENYDALASAWAGWATGS